MGIIALLYGIPYSIVGIAKGIKYKNQKKPISELKVLNELKEEGIITEDEFMKKKKEYL